jgi:hypothetical protein
MFHVEGTTKGELQAIIRANVDREAQIMTDEGRWYLGLDKDFASHGVVNHSRKEYARGRSRPTPSKARSPSSSAA